MDRRAFLAATGGGVAALAGCLNLSSSAATDGDFDVGMTARAFTPSTVTVSVGDTVVWRNTSGANHSVTAQEAGLPDGAEYFASGGYETQAAADEAYFQSFGGAIQADETYEHTFEVAGEYPYYCVPHRRAGMVGTVVVE